VSECPRVGKWFRGCRFEARYDKGPPRNGKLEGSRDFIIAYVEKSKPITYVRDVCRTCGKTIERQS